MVLVVTLTVRARALDAFRVLEHAAARVMSKHGGAIERVIVLAASSVDEHREVHLVTFPDARSFDAYRADPELAALAPTRAAAVVSTEILVGEDGPAYGRS